MKVLLLGVTGMLGSEVYKVLAPKYDVIPTTRKEFDADEACRNPKYMTDFFQRVGTVDYVINAIGVTIAHMLKNPAMTYFVNGSLPHLLAREYGSRLIHITTDCFFSGTDGKAPYHEHAELSPIDVYGVSKSLGEPESCLTIRTSIVGKGGDGTSLLGWFLQQRGTVNGYTDHIWNGITTRQFGLVCDKIMSNRKLMVGKFHVFSNAVSKCDMLYAFKKKFNVPCEIIPVSGGLRDRRLSTIYGFNDWLKIPTFQQMIEEM